MSEDGRGFEHGRVCYLQIPAIDTVRSAEFYEAVFGWRIERPYPEFEAPGLIGQWVADRAVTRDAGPLFWIAVSSVSETMERAAANGGEIINGPVQDGPHRILATIGDPAGNPVGIAGHIIESAGITT
jgi:uncharacterized protein